MTPGHRAGAWRIPVKGNKEQATGPFSTVMEFFLFGGRGRELFFFFLEANWDTNCGEGKFKKYQVFPVTPVMDGNLEGEERMEEDMVTKRES